MANVTSDGAATCPAWNNTLEMMFNGSLEMIRYVLQLLGYSIAGLVDEHILPICWGDGNNGKNTVWNTVVNLLGDYATLAS